MRYSRYRRWRMRQRAYWSDWWTTYVYMDLTGWWIAWPEVFNTIPVYRSRKHGDT